MTQPLLQHPDLHVLEALVKTGGQTQFGYLSRMVLPNIGSMNAESFCERTLSCASLIVTDLYTNLSREEERILTIIRMNVSLRDLRPRVLMECNVVLDHTTLHFPRH